MISTNRRKFLLQAAGTAGVVAMGTQALAESHAGPALPDVPTEGRELDIGDAKLFYIDSGGEGEVVVLLHSMTGSAHTWEKQFPALIAAGYRVVAYSRRGHRGSSAIDPNAMGTGAEDLKALLDGLGIEKFHAMGTAGGGYYLMDFAAKWHPMLLSITYACSILAINEPDFLQTLQAMAPYELLDKMPSYMKELGPAYRAADPEGKARWEELEHGARYDEKLMQPLLHGVTWPEVAGIAAPVMLISGGADLFVTPTLMEIAAKRLQKCETHVVPNAGHSAYWEDPKTFNKLLLDFMARHGASA